VVRETRTDVGTSQVERTITYTLGHDQISQTTVTYSGGLPGTSETLAFGYDGRGSTRLLTDRYGSLATVGGVRQLLDYDAYGNLLNMSVDAAGTRLLYNGEMFEVAIGQQYLRAGWYDPTTGLFNRLDPFVGNLEDPQTLHKYLYAHGDPVTFTDPSGLLSMGGLAAAGGFIGLSAGLVHGAILGARVSIGHSIIRGPLEGGAGLVIGAGAEAVIGYGGVGLAYLARGLVYSCLRAPLFMGSLLRLELEE